MRLKTIFIIVVTILVTIVITQNDSPVYLKVLFFTARTSQLITLLAMAIIGFVIGFLVGRPKTQKLGNDYGHGYDEHDDTINEGLTKPKKDTLSDEDRDYISND
jgi:uncharacterized integral membrane protein